MLERAHATASNVTGPGRPLDVGKPVAHAYTLHVAAQFQGLLRDLHDLAAQAIVRATAAPATYESLLIGAMTKGRGIDRGNATITTLQADFRRLGIKGLNGLLGQAQPTWQSGDNREFRRLLDLRNALAHGNADQLSALRQQGVYDTVTWTRQRLPMLNRMARAFDHVLWDHLVTATGKKPW